MNLRDWWRFWGYKYPMAVSETICLYLLQRNHLVSPLTFLRLFTRSHSKQADPALYPLSSEKGASIRAPCRGSLFTPKPLPLDAGAGALGADRVQKVPPWNLPPAPTSHVLCSLLMFYEQKKLWEVIVTVKASGPPNWFGLFIVLIFFFFVISKD